MSILIWSLLLGGLLGGLLSTVFGVFSVKSANAYSRILFGMNSGTFLVNGTVALLSCIVVFLITVSCLVRDTAYPVGAPINFTIETLLMAFPPALAFLAATHLRGYSLTTSDVWEEFGALVMKFGVLQLLLQFSGFWSYFIPPIQYS